MIMNRTLIAAAMSLACVGAFAQSATTQRDVNQQARIENGLKDGSLSTREAASLEKKEGQVDRMQARDMKDGHLSASETTRLDAAQNRVGRDIAADRHNSVTGHPDSASSQRMQADVARNVSQEKRIEAGVRNGSLTVHEAARLQRGQAQVDRKEALAGRDGHVDKLEQGSVQRSENRQGARIRRQKADAQHRG